MFNQLPHSISYFLCTPCVYIRTVPDLLFPSLHNWVCRFLLDEIPGLHEHVGHKIYGRVGGWLQPPFWNPGYEDCNVVLTGTSTQNKGGNLRARSQLLIIKMVILATDGLYVWRGFSPGDGPFELWMRDLNSCTRMVYTFLRDTSEDLSWQ